MGETFYTALGVDDDADQETIRSAYRDHVKETHPDVSDKPGAAQEFKRLTTARDVLLDDVERRRYDRLGHSEYVREHVANSAWSVPDPQPSTTTTDRTASTTAQTASQQTTVRESATTTTSNSQTQTAGSAGSESRTDGGYGNAAWQTASEAYRRSETNVEDLSSSRPTTLLDVARALGPWVFVHGSLLLSAIATGWFFYAMSTNVELTFLAFVSGILLIALMFGISMVHILLELYS